MKLILFLTFFVLWGVMVSAGNPKVVMETNLGTMVIELYPEKAPKTVQNFLKYVKAGFYDNTIFHRVIKNFMIQGGGFTADLNRKETNPPIQNEADNGLKNERGTIAMARTGDPHSATAQFFINVVDNQFLDHTGKADGRTWGYCVFGKVVKGMDVTDKIANLPTGAHGSFDRDFPNRQVVIKKVTIEQTSTQSATTK